MNFPPLAHLLLLLLLSLAACHPPAAPIHIALDAQAPPVAHGLQQLQELLAHPSFEPPKGHGQLSLLGSIDSTTLEPEAFQIAVDGDEARITAGDATGLMYALLDIRDQLQAGNRVITPKEERPNLAFRAIKFNLPWDSYRTSKALDLHYETCRDTAYWEAFLDMMADNRFNVLTLWNLHPFNFLVKTEKYPEACAFTDEELAEWQAFWHALFRMAKERGIETYLVNWNIFVSDAFANARDAATYSVGGAHFIEQGDTSELVKDYTRESVREVIDQYPNLTGLGITLGEGMGGMTAEEREQWLLDSVIEGMRQASRKIKFIHRVPLSAGTGSGGSTSVSVEKMTRQTLDTLSCVDGPMTIELKFNWSHAYSSPRLVKVHGGKLTDAYWNPLPENYRLAWMMRNEDMFLLRWGQPEFIRQHLALNTPAYVHGYFVGSECYIPAKDYLTSLPGASYRYAFERQWMFYHLWGRLLYNPQTPNRVFEQAFTQRFPQHGATLFSAQQKVSQVPLVVASFMNATWDFTLYSEGLMALKEGRMRHISHEHLAAVSPLDPRYLSVTDFVASGGKVPEGFISPLQLADSLVQLCAAAQQEIEGISSENNTDLRYESGDMAIWAQIGLHFAHKLRTAVAYQRYQNTQEEAHRQQALAHLEDAISSWEQLVEVSKPLYEPVPLVHYNDSERDRFHWTDWEEDLELERQALQQE